MKGIEPPHNPDSKPLLHVLRITLPTHRLLNYAILTNEAIRHPITIVL